MMDLLKKNYLRISVRFNIIYYCNGFPNDARSAFDTTDSTKTNFAKKLSATRRMIPSIRISGTA